MALELERLFQEAGRSVDRTAFATLCGRMRIGPRDADAIFEDLDQDHDGRISVDDFSRGFADFLHTVEARERGGAMEEEAEEEDARQHVWAALTSEAERVGKKHSDEGKLKWLLDELRASEQRHLVPLLESAVEELMVNTHRIQEEKGQLEESWKREKLEHERHLKRMEEEMDCQIKEAEMRLRLKAQAEMEDERKSLQSKMDSEMENLQAHLVLFEKVNSWLQTQPSEERDVRLEELRLRLEETAAENRRLRMSQFDTQTSVAVMRRELLQLRTLYEEKFREVISEREQMQEVLQEHDHLSRQLAIMHDVNRRLLDSHDAMKSSVESSPNRSEAEVGVAAAANIAGTPREKNGSIIGDYLDHGLTKTGFLRRMEGSEEDLIKEASPLRRARSMDISPPILTKSAKMFDRRIALESPNQSDSGVSTIRDASEAGDSWEGGFPSRGVERPRLDSHLEEHISDKKDVKYSICSSSSQGSLPDSFPRKKISDIIRQLGIEEAGSKMSYSRSWSPSSKKTPPTSDVICPPVPMPRSSKVTPVGAHQDRSSVSVEERSGCEDSLDTAVGDFTPTGPAEHTFKVIFVGDAGVGKSSFALRLSKGVFVRHMSSTLGVDFLMRTIRVDGRNVAVQLWDTAGQERFRSITKSYFRKADGVMLLYDCTCEQSFLSVRQWVDDVDVACFYLLMAGNSTATGRKASTQRLPLMIVANKTDLRETALQSGTTCISTEEGESLAKDCGTTFMEASAKDGSNVLHALANLVRSMCNHQELQLSASTLEICDVSAKKSSGCCGK